MLQVEQEGEQQRPLQVSRLFHTTNNTNRWTEAVYNTIIISTWQIHIHLKSNHTHEVRISVLVLGSYLQVFCHRQQQETKQEAVILEMNIWGTVKEVLARSSRWCQTTMCQLSCVSLCRDLQVGHFTRPWSVRARSPGRDCQVLNDQEHSMTSGYITDDASQHIPRCIVHFLELSHCSNQSADFKFRIVYIHVYFLSSTFCSSASWSKHWNWQNLNSEILNCFCF